MFFGFLIDFTDEFSSFRHVPVFGSDWPHHERIEDVFGIAGFLLFMIGLSAEVSHMAWLNTENVKLIARLNENNKKLKELDQLKSSFVSSVSHELRTPLSTIRVALSNLKEDCESRLDPVQRRFLEISDSSIIRLSRMIEDLLDLAKIESGKMAFKRELFNISLVMKDTIFSLRPKIQAEKGNIEIVEDYGEGVPEIWADKDRITQVILNVLHNAVEFTPDGGMVSVRTAAINKTDGVQIDIRDTGVGIPSDKLERVFDKFESTRLSNRSGSGLGLAISKDIVELHGGRVWVESEPGKGSIFSIQLPKDLRKAGLKGDS